MPHPAPCRPPMPALCALSLALFGAGAGAAELPRIQFVAGDVQVLRADGSRGPVHKGDTLNSGDRLLTGPGAIAQIRAADRGVVAVRPASEVQFKPQGPGSDVGLDVVLNRGRLRAVSDLGRAGLLQVITPDSKITVDTGDIETGVLPAGGGAETFNLVRSGEVTLNPDSSKAAPLPAGAVFKTTGETPLQVAALPTTQLPGPVALPDTAEAALPSEPLLPVTQELALAKLPPQTVSLDMQAPTLAVAGVNPVTSAAVAVPQVRVETASATIVGGSDELNQLMKEQRVLSFGRVNQDKTLTLSNDKSLVPTLPPVKFQPTTIQLGNETVLGIAPPAKTAVIVGATPVKQLVLIAPAITPTPATPVVTVPQVKSSLLDTAALKTNTLLTPTTRTNLLGGITLGGLRK